MATVQNQCGNDRRSMTISVTLLGLTLGAVFFAYFTFSDTNNENAVDATTLQFATIVFRHGERNPNGVYPNDLHRDFVGGWGALTSRGSLQAYQLGERLRKRYRSLLPKNGYYSTNEMYVMSSATERCLMTAQSFLAGFLPPGDDDDDQRHALPIKWQPVAVNSVPRESDRLISQKAICAKYDEMLKNIYADPPDSLRTFMDENADLFDYVSKHTGANITTIAQGEHLYNILFIEKTLGLELPKWTDAVFPNRLLAVAERNLAVLTENDYMKRVRGGYLVTNVLDNMVRIKNNQLDPGRKLFIYSGHDVTLVNVMRALNISSQTTNKPEFASALHFELHHNPTIDDNSEVKIFYSFNHESEMKPIKIPNCDPCSLTNFAKSVESITIRDYEQTCSL